MVSGIKILAGLGTVLVIVIIYIVTSCDQVVFTDKPTVTNPFNGVRVFWKERTACNPQNACEKVIPNQITRREDRVTVVLMGYDPSRKENYQQIFESYLKMKNTVDQIIFIWNNLEKEPPTIPDGITFIRAEKNDMMNRYTLAHPLSRVDALLTIDDDVLIREGLLRCMLKKLHENENTIVGLDSRHVDLEGSYAFDLDEKETMADLIIGKTMLMHKKHHQLAELADKVVRQSVLKGEICESCDDIVMNAIVGLDGTGPITIRKDIWPNVRTRLPSPNGVSDNRSWLDRRSNCTRWLIQHFKPTSPFPPPRARKEYRCIVR
eukprot:m.19913 g.19913  ORF g.19913 m.19913 type:complete len:321 (+) comp6715_c0_seq1:184-1146(+)